MKAIKKFLNLETKLNEKEFELIALELNSIFQTTSDYELVNYLKQLDTTTSVCAKPLSGGNKIINLGIGAWTCKQCQQDASCIICNDCYEKSKDKHKDHIVTFKGKVSGCCDCGDPSAYRDS
jgi:hypothetical protein